MAASTAMRIATIAATMPPAITGVVSKLTLTELPDDGQSTAREKFCGFRSRLVPQKLTVPKFSHLSAPAHHPQDLSAKQLEQLV